MKPEIKPNPDDHRDKTTQVRDMFDAIAFRYDFLNHVLSLGIDFFWRYKALSFLKKSPHRLLDIATGTGDLAFQALKQCRPKEIIGVDISENMLAIARQKAAKKQIGEDRIRFQTADGLHLPFDQDYFDAVTVAFGVRNFADLDAGLREMHRVLRPDGQLIILELTQPRQPLRFFYKLHTRYILPILGRLFSKSQHAYEYLPRSILAFVQDEAFLAHLRAAGFQNTRMHRLTGGIVTVYYGQK